MKPEDLFGMLILGVVAVFAWVFFKPAKEAILLRAGQDVPTDPRSAGVVFSGPLMPNGSFFSGVDDSKLTLQMDDN